MEMDRLQWTFMSYLQPPRRHAKVEGHAGGVPELVGLRLGVGGARRKVRHHPGQAAVV